MVRKRAGIVHPSGKEVESASPLLNVHDQQTQRFRKFDILPRENDVLVFRFALSGSHL